MLPWGTDETFEQIHHLPFEGRAGVLFDFCLEDPACASIYWRSLDSALTSIEGLDLDAMAARLSDLQAPWQQLEKSNDRFPYEIEEIEDAVAETRDFLTSRPAEAQDWLALNDPRPQTTIDTPPPATTNDPTPTIAFSSSKPNSTFECKVDAGAFAACTSPITLAALGDGPHSFEVRATDAVGNTDPDAALASFAVDTVAPQTTIDTPPPATTNDPTPTIAFSSSKPNSTFECKVDAGAFAACTSPITLAALGDGPHSFEVRATDAVDNTDPDAALAYFAVDTAAPQTTIDTPPPATTNDPTPTIAFSSSKPNSSFECKVDAGAFAACTSPITLAALADGPHSFEVRATDALDNTDPDPALAYFAVDTAAPQTTITRQPPARSRDRTPRFKFSSADPAAVFTCSIDSKPFRPCRSPQSYGKLNIGKHLFQVKATDQVSNEAAPTVWKFRIVARKASRSGRRH